VRVTLSAPDLMALDIVGTVVERLDVDDAGSDTFEDADEGEAPALRVTVAVDLDDASTPQVSQS